MSQSFTRFSSFERPSFTTLHMHPLASCICILLKPTRFGLVWFCTVLYEVFPMSFLMEQAGGQSFTGKERVGFLLLFIFFRNSRNNFVFLSTLRVQFAAKHADTLALAGSWSGPNQDPREVPGIPRQLRRRGRDQSIVRRTGKDKLRLIRASYEV